MSSSSPIASAARHPRAAVLVVVVAILVPAWAWIIVLARDMYGSMQGPSAWMMTPVWDAPRLVLLWAMWAVMMAAMMLPTAAPLLLLYAGSVDVSSTSPRPGQPDTASLWLLAAGYVAVWAVFSAGATAMQRALANLLVLTPMMEPSSARAGGVLLLLAGLYQLTPLKRMCVRSCRSPLAFLTRHWRAGRLGAFGMGIDHGIHCLGCCWALMLLLFAGGVMNLTVIFALTGWVLVEKLTPFGETSAVVAGVALFASGLWMVSAA